MKNKRRLVWKLFRFWNPGAIVPPDMGYGESSILLLDRAVRDMASVASQIRAGRGILIQGGAGNLDLVKLDEDIILKPGWYAWRWTVSENPFPYQIKTTVIYTTAKQLLTGIPVEQLYVQETNTNKKDPVEMFLHNLKMPTLSLLGRKETELIEDTLYKHFNDERRK